MEEEQKTELGFADIMKELGKIMESLQKIVPTQSEPTPAPQPQPELETETETETETEDDEKTDVGDAEEIDKILKDA